MKAADYQTAAMTHSDTVEHVLAYGEQYGWSGYAPETVKIRGEQHLTPYVVKPANGITTGKGFYDVTLAHLDYGLMLLVEIKTGKARLEPAQRRWRDHALRLEELGGRVFYYLLRPRRLPEFELMLRTGQPWLPSSEEDEAVDGGPHGDVEHHPPRGTPATHGTVRAPDHE